MSDLRPHWTEVHGALLDVLAKLGPQLGSVAVGSATEYLENNELELALRIIQEAAVERDVPLQGDAFKALERAAFLMKIEL